MNTSDKSSLSRREWMERLSVPVLVGSTLLAANSRAAESSENKLLGAKIYNVRDFGAKGDGTTLDTAAVQAAIDACTKDRGGVVLIPAGDFVIGSTELKSNVTLHIAAQGKILGTVDGKQYHAADGIPLEGDSTLGDGNVGLIFAVKAENITIEGTGTIDGQGAQFRSPSPGVPPPAGIGGAKRPYHLLFHQCKNLIIRDIFLKDSAFHSVRIIQSQYVKVDGIHIHSRLISNADGFHFISSQYVHITNCDVECQDDACALFGSNKFVTVSNCTFTTRWSVFRFGGGDPENVTVSNCVIYETYGCPIKMRFSSRSKVQNLTFSNIIMKDVTGPISIGLSSRSRQQTTSPTPEEKGFVRNIRFSNIRATVVAQGQQSDFPWPQNYRPGETRQCIVLNGVGEEFLEEISFNDVHITYEGGGTAEEAKAEVPQLAGEYFEIGTPPAYGLYARNVRKLTLNDVRFEVTKADVRPAVIFDHVQDAAVHSLSAQGNKEAAAVLRFVEPRDVLLTASRVLTPAAVFLQAEGAATEGITIDGGDLTKAAAPLAFKNGADSKAVKLRA